ncbi:hypothetical protein Aduo_018706 [Ancylostoma duodenale]
MPILSSILKASRFCSTSAVPPLVEASVDSSCNPAPINFSILGAPYEVSENEAQEVRDNEDSSPKFIGEREVSKFGKKPTMRYNIPGGLLCYVFIYFRSNNNSDIFRCRGCMMIGKHVVVRAVGDEFLSDLSVGHHYIPCKTTKDKVQRVMFKKYQEIRTDPSFAKNVTEEVWEGMLESLAYDPSMGTEEERQEISELFHDRELINVHKEEEIALDNVPDSLAILSDGSKFLQFQTPTFQMYYSKETIKVLPRKLGDNAQLYTIHGVCNNAVEVPLLHAVTTKKTVQTYARIFETVRQELEAVRIGKSEVIVRVILDFEKAAINAAKRTFDKAELEGCGWHLSQAWTRKRDNTGLRQYVCARRENVQAGCYLVEHFERTSFPTNGLSKEGTRYISSTDASGTRGVHRMPRVSVMSALDVDRRAVQGTVVTLLHHLRRSNLRANFKIRRLEQVPTEGRHLRKRDRERRIKVAQCMKDFERLREVNRICMSTSDITLYCRRMFRFTSGESI